jgi:threonine/homoserine/homoserine lactone efflux protein
MQNVFPFLLGLLLSFLGQLPLGTMSLTATQIAVQENFRNAWKYAVGVALIEMVYLRAVLSGMQWITGHHMLFIIFNWLTVAFFLVFGVMGFVLAQKQDGPKKALLLNNRIDRFFLGMGMSFLNPVQIPFWFIWTAYFLNMGWLKAGFSPFNFFTVGSGIGTVCGLAVYIYGGNWLVTKMKTSNRMLNTVAGIIFIVAAIVQAFRMLYP